MKANVYMVRYSTSTGNHTKRVIAHSELDALDMIWDYNSEASEPTATQLEGEDAKELIQWELSNAVVTDGNYNRMEDVQEYKRTLTAKQLIAFEAAGIELDEVATMREVHKEVFNYLNK